MFDDLLIRFRALLRRKSVESELDDEIRFHFEAQVAKYIASGTPRDEATRRARLEFGGLDQVKEECRDARGIRFLETLMQDIRYGLRMLRKSPGFTIVAVLTLALGIGANTAIFSILESQLWRPLPFPDSEHIYAVNTRPPDNPTRWFNVTGPEFLEWRERAHAFDHLAGFDYPVGRNFSTGPVTTRAEAMSITSGFFETLQIQPALGRAFDPADDVAGNENVAVITYALWRDAFHSDPDAIGKSFTLDGVPHRIIGVAPAGLRLAFTLEPDLFVPLRLDIAISTRLSNDRFNVIGHLAPGITEEQARAEMTSIIARQTAAKRDQAPKQALVLEKLRIAETSYAASPLFFFAGAVALVLLIACVNVTGLLLARGLMRQREFALRTALGARRSAIVRQVLVETLLLGSLGASAGILLSYWGTQVFAGSLPQDFLPRTGVIEMDAKAIVFAVAISIFTAAIMALVPALFASRVDSNDVLRQSGRSVTGGRSQNRARGLLVVVEMALALILLFGAGIFLDSFVKLQQAPLGFDPQGILTMRLMLRGPEYRTPAQIETFYQKVGASVQALPGVKTLAVSGSIPLSGGGSKSFTIAGRPVPKPGEEPDASLFNVTPDFFSLFRMRFLAGRSFTITDNASAPRVAIINRNFAQHFFPNESPVGKVLNLLPGGYGMQVEPGAVQIVGVIENTQEFGANEIPFDDLYVPFEQSPSGKTILSVKSDLPASTLLGEIRSGIAAIDKDHPVYDVQTMDDRVSDSLKGARFNLLLVASLAVTAIILVAVGLFGTVSYFVQQRTHEFGVRAALGASPLRILQHSLGQALRSGIAGLALGLAASLVLGRLLRHALYLAPHEHSGMLYGVSIYDPLTMALACALLVVVILAAGYFPARRAAKVDPLIALRYE